MTDEDIGNISQKVSTILNEEFLASKDCVPKRRDWLSAYWTGFKSPEQISRVRNTGYFGFFVNFNFHFGISYLYLLMKLAYYAGLNLRY